MPNRKKKSFITFPRIVAVAACMVVAFVGSVMFFAFMLGGSYTPAPATHQVKNELEGAGVTTRAEPLFDVPRQNGELVSLHAQLTHDSVERGSRTDMAAAVGVRAWGDTAGARQPIELALVFDVSGSMDGQPLNDVKTAAVSLLSQLEPRDRVAIIAYSSDAWVVSSLKTVTNANRAQLRTAIYGLEADGGTNISAGWELGKAQLEAGRGDGPRRIILLSDGQANEGIIDIGTLGRMTSSSMESGVTTTALGVGLDYNEDLMQRMARSGGGNYYFVHDAAPSRAFDDELATLTKSVTSRARLRITTGPNLRVTNIEGFDWRPLQGGAEIELGALAAGMRRDALVEFGGTTLFEPALVQVELSWLDAQSGTWRKQAWSQMITAEDDARYDALVLSRLQKVKTARALHNATLSYQSGDRERAANMLDVAVTENERFVDTYDVDEDVFDRANDSLAEFASDIRRYDPSSNRGKYMIKGSKFKSANVAVDSSVTF